MSKRLLENPRASLYPVPVTLISCANDETSNIITVSWTGIMCSHPPIVYISIRSSRKTHQILQSSSRFCINIPSIDIIDKVEICGSNSGRYTNKAKMCGFDMISLVPGYPDAIAQCKHHLFCDVVQSIELGSHTAFIAEVNYEFIEDNCVTGDHVFSYEKIKPIGYCRKEYYSMSSLLLERITKTDIF